MKRKWWWRVVRWFRPALKACALCDNRTEAELHGFRNGSALKEYFLCVDECACTKRTLARRSVR